MDKLLLVGQWVVAHYQDVIAGVSAALGGVIAISMLIPGEQPEKALQSVVNFLAKFSKK